MAKLKLTSTRFGEEDKITYIESNHPCFITPDDNSLNDKIDRLSILIYIFPSNILPNSIILSNILALA